MKLNRFVNSMLQAELEIRKVSSSVKRLQKKERKQQRKAKKRLNSKKII